MNSLSTTLSSPLTQTKNPRIKLVPAVVTRPIRISLILSLALSILTAVSYPRLQPQIPLFYSLSIPEQQLAAKGLIFLLPGLSMLINLIHIVLIRSFNKLDTFILRLFAWSTVVIQLIILMITLRLLLII